MSKGMAKIKQKIRFHKKELLRIYDEIDDMDHLPCIPDHLIVERDYHINEKNRLLRWSKLKEDEC